jgi:hypothetical protein
MGESNEASSSAHPLAGDTRSSLWLPVTVHVTVPPTLIVVTFVPLASSTHLKFDPLTDAVVGAPGADAVGEAVGVAVAVTVAVGLGEIPGVGTAFVFGPGEVHDEMQRNSPIVRTKPRTLNIVFSSFDLYVPITGFVSTLQ